MNGDKLSVERWEARGVGGEVPKALTDLGKLETRSKLLQFGATSSRHASTVVWHTVRKYIGKVKMYKLIEYYMTQTKL